MSTLPIRIVSALFAAAMLVAIGYFFETPGLTLLGAFIFGIGAIEYSHMAFQPYLPAPLLRPFKLLFLFFALVLLFTMTLSNLIPVLPVPLFAVWAVMIALFISFTIWLLRNKIENSQLLPLLGMSGLGFFYCALLPAFVVEMLYLKEGLAWFALLALVVFAGDTFAYFGGIILGKNKLMPSLSPSKTVEGSISGLLGSVVAGLLVGSFFLESVPLFILIITSAVSGFLAQNGDLFESLVKRVATVKDSGRIMPGHGGVLDRLDGIYFAAPAVFAAAYFCQ